MAEKSRLLGWLVVLGLAASAAPVQAQFNPYFNPYNPQGQGAFANPYMNAGVVGSNPYVTGYNPYTPAGAGTNPYTPGVSPNPYYPSPYGGYGSGGYNTDPYGLYGTAAVMNAYGQFSNQVEQARLMREQALQAQIDTAKKRFDFQMYVKANTPTFTQEQAKIARSTLKRIQSNSTPPEISSGKALNILLDDVRKQIGKTVSMPPILLDEELLKNINVIKDSGNLGLVRDQGKFTWPIAFGDVLTAAEQTRIDVTTQNLVKGAFANKLDANLLRELRNLLSDAKTKLADKVNAIATSQYLEAKRFLNDFDDARLALERGEAPTYLEYREFIAGAKKNIDEVATYLVNKGLKIAPATARDEAAYRAFYSAMVAYDVALSTQGGIEVGAGERP